MNLPPEEPPADPWRVEPVAAVPGAGVVHTDDIAWWHGAFDWADLLAAGVLEPVRSGRAVAYRPPAWDARDRPGAVRVPAGLELLIVEGSGRPERTGPPARRRRLGPVRPGRAGTARRLLAADRPWERAGLVVAGTPGLRYDPAIELVVTDAPHR